MHDFLTYSFRRCYFSLILFVTFFLFRLFYAHLVNICGMSYVLINKRIDIRVVSFGTKLHALREEHFGLRQIAVGLTLRRLAS